MDLLEVLTLTIHRSFNIFISFKPNKTGINTSNTAAKFTALVAGWYTGFETAHASGTNGIGTFTLNETNSTIKNNGVQRCNQ
jgi:hypothetical protein